MNNIRVNRYPVDTQAAGSIHPEQEDRWQLVIDRDGYPHLWISVIVESDDGAPARGWVCVDDLLIDDLTIRGVMDGGVFDGKLSPEEEAEAAADLAERRESNPVPCPR